MITTSFAPDPNDPLVQTCELRVTDDAALPPAGAFANVLNTGQPFIETIDRIIEAADRYLYVQGNHAIPGQLAFDWANLLRWEFSTFWSLTPGAHPQIRQSAAVHVTPEHGKRVGEMLAYGLAACFLEDRLGISRSQLYFYSGNAARPDFVYEVSQLYNSGMAWQSQRFGLECRWRRAVANLGQRERVNLNRKKQPASLNPLSGILAVYFLWGDLYKSGISRTRIHVADPDMGPSEMTKEQRFEVAAHHYAGVASRVGLWGLRDYLQGVISDFRNNPSQPFAGNTQRTLATVDRSAFYLTRRIQGRNYMGCWFSPVVALVRNGGVDRRAAAQLLDQPTFGRFVFRGLDTRVVKRIANRDWDGVIAFNDRNAVSRTRERVGFSDGYIRSDSFPLSAEDRALVSSAISM